MIQDLNLILLSGGWHHCTPAWSMKTGAVPDHGLSGLDACYKLYFPVNGAATLTVGGETRLLEAGKVYLFNGFRLEEQCCADFMDVYWLHFIPESLFFNYFLNNNLAIHAWKLTDLSWREDDCALIPSLFENPFGAENTPAPNASFGVTCKVTAMILHLIGDLVDRHLLVFDEEVYQAYLRLKPALDYMEANYANPIGLKDIAAQVYLNPIYFHRLFKSCFRITPQEYLLAKRLNTACRYLNEKSLSIREISEALGFCNQFYFSEMFKKRFGASPSKYRRHQNIP